MSNDLFLIAHNPLSVDDTRSLKVQFPCRPASWSKACDLLLFLIGNTSLPPLSNHQLGLLKVAKTCKSEQGNSMKTEKLIWKNRGAVQSCHSAENDHNESVGIIDRIHEE
ncbi:MAG: hypothetical protein ACXVZU_03050 [Methanobacteriaceae archaeon]